MGGPISRFRNGYVYVCSCVRSKLELADVTYLVLGSHTHIHTQLIMRTPKVEQTKILERLNRVQRKTIHNKHKSNPCYFHPDKRINGAGGKERGCVKRNGAGT